MGDFGDRSSRDAGSGGGAAPAVQRSPGKRSLVEARYGVQRRRDAQPAPQDEAVHAAAEAGLAQPASSLPHAGRIQAAFGRHDVTGIQAHVGGAATAASEAMGAQAYATGDHVAFREAPNLHTAAHEAAHVVQQRAGVALKGGVGEAGDPYEQHADAVADAVVAGRSAESLLDAMAPASASAASTGAVQRQNLKQAGLDSGLTENGTGNLVSYTKKGKEYTEAVGTTASDRTAAMVKGAERNAVVGGRTTGKTWTDDGATWDQDDTEGKKTLDPFRFKVTMAFKNKDDDEKPHTLSLVYQHGLQWTGYVTSIEDSSNDTTDGGVTMYKHDDNDSKKGKKLDSDTYSNKHAKTGDTNLAGMTGGDKEEDLDAYTKIAGEGARWKCVRVHASNITDNTLFYTAHPSITTKVRGVTFRTLWLNWASAFSKAYDIGDATVVTAITSGGLSGSARNRDKSALTGADYNLDTGKPHGT